MQGNSPEQNLLNAVLILGGTALAITGFGYYAKAKGAAWSGDWPEFWDS